MKGREMTQKIESREDFLAQRPRALVLSDTRRSTGRVSPLQRSRLPGGLAREDITDVVGFRDGQDLRVLFGKARDVRQETPLIPDMGRGKSYRFRRLDSPDPGAGL